MTVGESRAMVGFSPDSQLRAQLQSSPPRNPWEPPIPFLFRRLRLKGPGRIHTPRDQGKCASSWAYTATSVIADRIAIHTNFLLNDNISPQQLISCDYYPNQNGCKAGDPLSAFQNYLKNIGCLSETCYPSTSNINGIRGTRLSGNYGRCPNPNAQFLKYRSKGGNNVYGALLIVLFPI
ncbi:tubulointerstitial nephritis antigen-like [Oscarella lobularis]|uniref:tubulointerstitial nephritis antigen-like n=1 Tax=Oscarella lobularis TaxID=121494 RepID=UPI0033133BBD